MKTILFNDFFFPPRPNKPLYARQNVYLFINNAFSSIVFFLIWLSILGISDLLNRFDNYIYYLIALIVLGAYLICFLVWRLVIGYNTLKQRFCALGYSDKEFILSYPILNIAGIVYALFKRDIKLLGIYALFIPIFFDTKEKRIIEKYKKESEKKKFAEILNMKRTGTGYSIEDVNERYRSDLVNFISEMKRNYIEKKSDEIKLNEDVLNLSYTNLLENYNKEFELKINYPSIAME